MDFSALVLRSSVLLPCSEVREPFKRSQKASACIKLLKYIYAVIPCLHKFKYFQFSHIRLNTSIFLAVTMLSWFCSGLISFFSAFLAPQPDVSSPGYGEVPEITRCFLGSQRPGRPYSFARGCRQLFTLFSAWLMMVGM